MKKSMIEVAYDKLSEANHPMSFLELWDDVASALDFNESQKDNNIAIFYSDLSMDARFISLEKNTWDLRKRQHFSSVVNVDDISLEDEDDDIEIEQYDDIEEGIDDDKEE